MSKKLKKRLYQIIAAGFIYVLAILLPKVITVNANIELILYLGAYLIAGRDVVTKAGRNLLSGQVFDENFLMSVATIGAFLVGEYPESVAVMLFYQVGELFQSYAVNKSRNSITELMDIAPDYANLKTEEGIEEVDPDEVMIEDIIVIKPGEKVPLDCIVTKGSSTLDTRALTGESIPREVTEGDLCISGCINLNGLLEARVTKEFGESTVTKILDLIENASSKKAQAENFITKFAKNYTPIVVFAALAVALIPPILMGGKGFLGWIYRALSFLVISCPCALVISVPLSFFGGLGGASRQGILVKGSNYLEALADVEIAVFDKTGTLTKGTFTVKEVESRLGGQEELLRVAAFAESFSSHPIAKALMNAYGKEILTNKVTKVEELAGFGVKAKVEERIIYAGNHRLMQRIKVSFDKVERPGTVVYVAVDGKYAGYIVIADTLKADAKDTIDGLKRNHITNIVMLTGDSRLAGETVANEVGITNVHTELLPADKVECVEKLFSKKSERGKLLLAGDGMNDAPVLARADIGVAMGGLGSDAAIEAADVVIMNDEPSKIVEAIHISKKTLRIVRQNIVFAIAVKIIVLLLAAVGFATMWAAVFADVGVTVIAICNAMRALNVSRNAN